MYQVEIKGKIPDNLLRKEDLLTSNVFSFFKYSERRIFLREYLKKLDLEVSAGEAEDALFYFWPSFEDYTEPDLVIIVGGYYLLVEAKYKSGFGKKTEKTDSQLAREIREGLLEAKNYKKEFKLVTITADNIYPDFKFEGLPEEYKKYIKWTNWQDVASFLTMMMEEYSSFVFTQRAFLQDLIDLLSIRGLRKYIGPKFIVKHLPSLTYREKLFFQMETATYRGDFIGFINTLYDYLPDLLEKEELFFKVGTATFRGDFIGFRQDLFVLPYLPSVSDKELFFRRE